MVCKLSISIVSKLNLLTNFIKKEVNLKNFLI